jgi:serine/threonine-protein kinase
MDTARWERIQGLFHEAAGMPESERAGFLEKACAADPGLMAEVMAMLRADGRGASLLDRGLPDVAHQMLKASQESFTFGGLGPYRLQRILGEGGMGVVWLAQREDAGNLVAIKFLPHAGLSPARRDRFAREIKTLAKLKHPFIARLYDAGSLADGTPWFAMEYVEGARFTEYCRERALSVEERLRLFRMVCEAVHYAHGQEIIHRDLKPSNILVESDGNPRLLDFGIARELHGLEETGEQTRPGLRFLSPDYAAPEWIREGRVGFYTDVYSLGVILYETLTGGLPPRSEGDPVKPSAAAHLGSALGKAAWSDLDVLCLAAMHKDVPARYQSVEALMRDVDHFLKGEPLEARPDTFSYRLSKFARRNRKALVAASLVIALVVGLIVFFTLRLEKARDNALAEAARTRRVEQFIANVFEGGDAEVGPTEDLKVITLLDSGVKKAAALKGDPAMQAELYQTLGSVYESLGKLDQADSLLQMALERRKSVFGPDHPEVAESLLYLGGLRRDQAKFAESERLVREALAMDRRHLPAEHPAIAMATSTLGQLLVMRGSYDQAIGVLTEAVRLQTASGEKTDQLATLTLLANAHHYLGHYALSDSLNRQVLAMDIELHGKRHPDVADDYINLGSIQSQWGHHREAEGYYRQALEIKQAWYGQEHAETADCMSYVAKALTAEGRYDEAEGLSKRALAILERVYAGAPHPKVAVAVGQLGTIALLRGNLDEAERDFKRMEAIYRAVYGDRHQMTAVAMSNVASVDLERGQNERAEQLLRGAIERFQAALPAGHMNTAVAEIRLGHALVGEKRYQEAEKETRAGYEALTKQTGQPVSAMQMARRDLAAAYEALHEPEKAAKFRHY